MDPGGCRMSARNRQPVGIPIGGQFAAAVHAGPEIGLTEGLQVDSDSANYFADQVESIREAGLKGSITAGEEGDVLTYTAPDGTAFDIRQGGEPDIHGNPGWAIDNHEHANVDHPAYGLRRETTTWQLGDALEDALFDTAVAEAGTLNGSDDLEYRGFFMVRPEGAPAACADFTTEAGDDVEVIYSIEERKLTVWRNSEIIDGAEADGLLTGLVEQADIEAPGGSPSGQAAWHMERSFRIAAAKHDSPEWAHEYRVDGLTWEDRN